MRARCWTVGGIPLWRWGSFASGARWAGPWCHPAPAPADMKLTSYATAIQLTSPAKGVQNAVANVRNEIAPRLAGLSVIDQARIDRTMCELDGTPNKSRLGANAILGVSLACAHAAAAFRGVPLWRHLDRGRASMPLPMVNMIS